MYVGIMAVVFVLFFREQGLIGIFAGLLVSGPLYLGFGYVLAKFGYQRKTWRELRADAPTRGGRDARDGDGGSQPGPKPKPAPTSRTGGTPNRPGGNRKKRR